MTVGPREGPAVHGRTRGLASEPHGVRVSRPRPDAHNRARWARRRTQQTRSGVRCAARRRARRASRERATARGGGRRGGRGGEEALGGRKGGESGGGMRVGPRAGQGEGPTRSSSGSASPRPLLRPPALPPCPHPPPSGLLPCPPPPESCARARRRAGGVARVGVAIDRRVSLGVALRRCLCVLSSGSGSVRLCARAVVSRRPGRSPCGKRSTLACGRWWRMASSSAIARSS